MISLYSIASKLHITRLALYEEVAVQRNVPGG
jgi:hypothetical protein